MNDRLNKILLFLKEIEKLKLIKRIPYLSDGITIEDDAQHSWYVAMMLLTLEKEFSNEFDTLRTLKMLLLHDLVEIHTGDDWVTTKEAKELKRQKELESADKIFPILPNDLSQEFRELWEEYDLGMTTEAKIAKGLDKLSYSLQYNISNKIKWYKGNDTVEEVIQYAGPHLKVEEVLERIMEVLMKEREENERKGINASPKIKVKAIIFDYDLTLADTRDNYARARQDLTDFHDISFENIDQKVLWGGNPRMIARAIKEANSDNQEADKFEDLLIKYTLKHCSEAVILHQDFLKRLRTVGIKLGIVTGNLEEAINEVLKNPQNSGVKFDLVSGQVKGIEKKKPEMIKGILDKWNIDPSESIYVGDHVNDIIAAKEAGTMSCAVATGLHSEEELLIQKPDILIRELIDLEKYLDL